MTTTLGDAGEVRIILGTSESELDTPFIETLLNQAVRWIESYTSKSFITDQFYATVKQQTGTTNTVYETFFPITEDTNKAVAVYVDGAELVENTDFTVNRTTSRITFDSSYSLNSGSRITVNYTPSFFDDWANYEAALRILRRSAVNLPEGESGQAIRSEIKEQTNLYRKMVDTKPFIARWVDHKEDGTIY